MRKISKINLLYLVLLNISTLIRATDIENIEENFVPGGRILKFEDFSKYGINISEYPEESLRNAFLTVPEVIEKNGYPVEIHKVTTGDGYILEMHRIPKKGGIPVFLMHGLLDSSAGWIIAGQHSAFGYYLSDLGYDVWMGNARGNRYSKNHSHLSKRSRKFWDFSFHEIGSIDLPTMIDFVLDKTDYKKIHYVGHSQGTTAFWIMCSERPIYCNKIISMQAFAPVAYLNHIGSRLLRFVSENIRRVGYIVKLIGWKEFVPHTTLPGIAGQLFCKDSSPIQQICENIFFLVAGGYGSNQLNKTMLPTILGHVPAGAASKQLLHYGQIVKSEKFRMYDYGFIKNIRKYGILVWPRPPLYNFKEITAPVHLHHSHNDGLAPVNDVIALSKELPNVVGYNFVPLPQFNHIDFIYGIQSRELVYEKAVKSMKDVESETAEILKNEKN